MPQINYPVMISIDWLELFGNTSDIIDVEQPATSYAWEMKTFGSKMWLHIFDVYILEDGVYSTHFATVCTGLRGKVEQPLAFSLKLSNEFCYRQDKWQQLTLFMSLYRMSFVKVSRCDLAADFIYLHNRVSGVQLVKNIKSLKWWKCGSVNCSEHYTLPYSVKWSMLPKDMEYQEWQQQGTLQPRVESLTFGTKSSFAQVIIYDKTLELSVHSIDGVAAKEYIRDCWKKVGCFDEKRHTWRIEIRMSSKAMSLKDPFSAKGLRPVNFLDLQDDKLPATFKSAADVWFRLVDASDGGKITEITQDYIEKKRANKSRFDVVTLFNWESLQLGFTHGASAKMPSRFTKAMINRIEQTANEIATKRIKPFAPTDTYYLGIAATILRLQYTRQKEGESLAERFDGYEQVYRQLILDLYKRYIDCPSSFTVSRAEFKVLEMLTAPDSPISRERREQILDEPDLDIFNHLKPYFKFKIKSYEPDQNLHQPSED